MYCAKGLSMVRQVLCHAYGQPNFLTAHTKASGLSRGFFCAKGFGCGSRGYTLTAEKHVGKVILSHEKVFLFCFSCLQFMAHAFTFGLKIFPIELIGFNYHRHILHNLKSVGLQTNSFHGVIGYKFYFSDT